jgi:hypothetical protein
VRRSEQPAPSDRRERSSFQVVRCTERPTPAGRLFAFRSNTLARSPYVHPCNGRSARGTVAPMTNIAALVRRQYARWRLWRQARLERWVEKQLTKRPANLEGDYYTGYRGADGGPGSGGGP